MNSDDFDDLCAFFCCIKRGITLSNGTEHCDADYYNSRIMKGRIMLALYNNTDYEVVVQNETCSSRCFVRYYTAGDTLDNVRQGGIGSTNG